MLEIIIELNLQGRRAVTSHWSAESMRTLRSSAWTPFTPPSSSPPYSTSTSALPSSGLLLQNSWRVTNRVARIDSPLRFPRICSQFQKFHSKFDARIAEHSTIRKCVRDLNFIFYSSFTFTRIVDNSINLLINYLYHIDDMLISFSKSNAHFRFSNSRSIDHFTDYSKNFEDNDWVAASIRFIFVEIHSFASMNAVRNSNFAF